MSAYRFCRTDDIPLLVDAWNRCTLPEAALTVAGFKTDIRELDLWCSSCMVAFESREPVAVLIGCKRPPDTLIHRLAVHPEHRRRGHGRHLLTSLLAKLAILGPPRVLAEVPEGDPAACGLFEACGFRHDRTYLDLVWTAPTARRAPAGVVVPAGVEELADVALPAPEAARSWGRSRATLLNRRERLSGRAIAAGDTLEAAVVYARLTPGIALWGLHATEGTAGEAALSVLLQDLAHHEPGPMAVPRFGDDEVPPGVLRSLGFVPTGETYRAVSSTPVPR